jgi:N-formylglutamate amidohydrolase
MKTHTHTHALRLSLDNMTYFQEADAAHTTHGSSRNTGARKKIAKWFRKGTNKRAVSTKQTLYMCTWD